MQNKCYKTLSLMIDNAIKEIPNMEYNAKKVARNPYSCGVYLHTTSSKRYLERTQQFINKTDKPITINDNQLQFPADFNEGDNKETEITLPDFPAIKGMMRQANDKKGGMPFFEGKYFADGFLENLSSDQLTDVIRTANNIIQNPPEQLIPGLGTLLDTGKYIGIAQSLVKLAMSVVTSIIVGVTSLKLVKDIIKSSVDFGRNIADQVKNL